ncbi:MAG: YgiT-type zinc finger protein [Nitrospira sp. LK70]|nr:YgiT-type zinc finger protein [Nitrospira sp. LK70]
MQCDFCGAQGAIIKKATKSFGHGDKLVIIENIPIFHCSRCHESYLTAETARELDCIRKNRHSLGKPKLVLVASFKKSAA